MQTGKRILAFLLALVLVASCIPASSIHADAAVIQAPAMTSAEDISTHVNGALTYFHAENLDTYKEWLEILKADGTYTEAIDRLSAGIAKLEEEGYTFYDDGALLGNYQTNGYEPTYYADTVTYYATVSAPSGKVITLHKAEWDEYADTVYESESKAVMFHWDAEKLSHVQVAYADSVGGARTAISNGDAVAWASGDMVLFFTVTLNKDNANKPEFLGALVGDGNYSIVTDAETGDTTDNTTDEQKYLRQGMVIEYYDMAPYKLDQSGDDNNHNSAYQVVWGGMESTRGDMKVLDNGGNVFSGHGGRVSDTPYAIGLGASQAMNNHSLVINAWNFNSVDIYGVTTPGGLDFYDNTDVFGFNLISHNSRFRSQYGGTKSDGTVNADYQKYSYLPVNNMMRYSNNWITLADAATYTKYWGVDADVAQIVPAGETISEFSVWVDGSSYPAIMVDYKDANNYSYLNLGYHLNSPITVHTITNGLMTSTTQVANQNCTAYTGSYIDTEGTACHTDDSTDTIYYGTARFFYMDTNYDETTLKFTWNDDKNCYDLTIDNWPLVASTYVGNNASDLNNSTTVIGTASRTISLPSVTGSQLSNLYLGVVENFGVAAIRAGEEDLTPSATASLFGAVAVKTSTHAHTYVAYTGEADSAMEATPATCYSYATYYGVCSICGQSSASEEVPATFEYGLGGYAEHTWNPKYNYDDVYHWQECLVCKANGKTSVTTSEAHDTAGVDGACSVCGINTVLDAVVESIMDAHYFIKANLADYQDWQSQLESLKEAEYYAAAYSRISNAVAKLEAGYTFYDDSQNLASYETLAENPAQSGEQTYYITVSNPAGQAITLYQASFTEEVTAGTPAEGQTAVYWDAATLTLAKVQYSADGGATLNDVENGVAFDVSGDIVLYVTIDNGETTTYREFFGFTVGETQVYRHCMHLTNGLFMPYELAADSGEDFPYAMIWGGIEATQKGNFATTSEYYDKVIAYTMNSTTGIAASKSSVNGMYFNYSSSYNGYGGLICPTKWGQYFKKVTDTATGNKLASSFNWLTLADKATYDAYYGVDSVVPQIIPAGEKLAEFTVDIYPTYAPQIIYDYVDPLNYSYVRVDLKSGNGSIYAIQVINGVETNVAGILGYWSGSTEIMQDSSGASLYYASINHLKNHSSLTVTLKFTWDETNNCYNLTAENWPLTTYYHDSNQNESVNYLADGYTASYNLGNLTKYQASGKQLSNVYVSTMEGNATIKIAGMAVKSITPDHKHEAADNTWHSDGASHFQLCECGSKLNEAACTESATYITENGEHYKTCTVCSEIITATKAVCSGDLIHENGEHYNICSTCNVEIEGTRVECGTTAGWQQENDQHWAEYECGAEVEKTACSGTEYSCANGTHQLICATCDNTYGTAEACSGTAVEKSGDSTHKLVCDACGNTYGEDIACSAQGVIIQGEGEHWHLCACGNTVDKEACTAGSEYDKDDTHHWQLCADCGQIVGDKVAHEYKEGTATYDHGNLCVCGAADSNVLTRDYLPTILGSKILKASNAADQKLRIDVDFTDLNNAIAAGSSVTEYGVIVAPLAEPVYTDENGFDAAALKALYGNSSYTVSSTASLGSQVDERIMSIGIRIPAADYGKRIVLIAYVKVDGELYYSENDNANVGLESGIINTGVMRVMKAILKDTTADGYANIYATAATTYYVEYAQYVEGYDAAAVIELIGLYLDGTIGTAHEKYEIAKTATMYVFHYSMYIYADNGNAAPSEA